jgi:magnesium chelatase subunit D
VSGLRGEPQLGNAEHLSPKASAPETSGLTGHPLTENGDPLDDDADQGFVGPGSPVVVDAETIAGFDFDVGYPEDEVPPQRAAASLRVPVTRQSAVRSTRGPVIGVEHARNVSDLAIFDTLLESVKYQIARRQYRPGIGPGLVVSPSDLRSYRRAPAPQAMLVLVLDHTVRRNWDWSDDLLPFVVWAYAERASVVVVRVGAAGADDRLRADRLSVRNVLDPAVATALDTLGGAATPLAHGLSVALQDLRHALQHGSALVREAWLVVATDGRGNVPLEASYFGVLDGQVTDEGVRDSRAVAAEIATLDGVHSVVLTPNPEIYPDLTFELARALRGRVGSRGSEEVGFVVTG